MSTLLVALLGFFPSPSIGKSTETEAVRPVCQGVKDTTCYYEGIKPYADLLAKPYRYYGPAEELAEPADVKEVKIGLFGPLRGRRAAAGLSMRRGVELAIAKANEEGGYLDRPFKCVFRSDDLIWGSAREVVKLVYEEKVWAVIGAIGGESTHIAEQIITKAHVPLISPASTDPSLTQINIPWMFRCMPDNERIARLLTHFLFRQKGYERVAAIGAEAYDSRIGIEELEKMARRFGKPLHLSLKYNPGDTDFSRQLRLLKRSEVQAIVVWGQPEEAAFLIREMRELGMQQEVLGGPELASPEFLKLAGKAAEGVIVVFPCNLWRDTPIVREFNRRFEERYGQPPDVIAAYAYDAANILVQAIREGGPNRGKIRDCLAKINFHGVTGTIHFDGSGSNQGSPILAVVRHGRFVPVAN